MSKKLKIQFWRAEKALAMQILEQEGLPKEKEYGEIRIFSSPDLRDVFVFLRGDYFPGNSNIGWITFATNTERDEYLQKAVNAITDELFTEGGELKEGEMCEVKDYKDEQWKKKKLIIILPAQYEGRFIAEWGDNPSKHSHWNYARPLTKRTEPIVEECGNVVTYTWEEK